MNYLTIKETALRWGVSERTVSALCSAGRVAGAKKFGTTWAIPADAEKPDDPRRERKKQATEITEINWAVETRRVAMPLLNTAFKLGSCAETALALESEIYPIPTIYLHLIACVGYLNMKHPEMAKEHAMEAWKIAQPDGFIHPISELHGLMGGTLEATVKRLSPNDFKRIISLTNKYATGWRRLHSRITGNAVPDNVTATEYAAAMLAARDWTSREIADHMGISEYTARRYVSEAIQKMNVPHRKELRKYLV